MKAEWRATITRDDYHFVERILKHYEIFLRATEQRGDQQTAGAFRKQLFYAEQFLQRLQVAEKIGGTDGS